MSPPSAARLNVSYHLVNPALGAHRVRKWSKASSLRTEKDFTQWRVSDQLERIWSYPGFRSLRAAERPNHTFMFAFTALPNWCLRHVDVRFSGFLLASKQAKCNPRNNKLIDWFQSRLPQEAGSSASASPVCVSVPEGDEVKQKALTRLLITVTFITTNQQGVSVQSWKGGQGASQQEGASDCV